MSGKAIIVLVTGIIIISSIIFYQINAASTRITANFGDYYLRQSAQNIAQSGVNLALRRYADDTTGNWRGTIGTLASPLTMLGGKVAVTVSDSTLYSRPVIKVMSIGIVEPGTELERRDTSIAFLPRKFHPISVRAVVTTNNNVTVNGNFTMDGRDHTPAGVVIPGTGVLGVWTTGDFNQGGSSQIGGTASAVDYAPARPANPAIIKEFQPYAGGYPGTPDSILGGASNGFPEGKLKEIAQSGAGGSQYTTNPATLTYPLKSITYVELPSGSTWNPANISGTGLLIVHNANKNAKLADCMGGNFVGLALIDDAVRNKNNIIGALICLTPNPSEGNTIGNGSGALLYSRSVVTGITDMIFRTLYTNGSSANVVTWWE